VVENGVAMGIRKNIAKILELLLVIVLIALVASIQIIIILQTVFLRANLL